MATAEIWLKSWRTVASYALMTLLGVGFGIFWIYKTEAWNHLNALGFCNLEPTLLTKIEIPEPFPVQPDMTETDAKQHLMDRIWQLERWGSNMVLRQDAIIEQCKK